MTTALESRARQQPTVAGDCGAPPRGPATPAAAKAQAWPRLLPGTELVGRFAGSGLREPPYLVRRCDGQLVALSRVLYVIAGCMDGRDVAAVAETASDRLQRRVGPEQIVHVAEHRLFEMGLVAGPDGSLPVLQPRDALLALQMRIGVISERAVHRLAAAMAPVFLTPVVVAVLLALLAIDGWLAGSHAVAAALGSVIQTPSLVLGLFGVTVASLVFHEFGHATACRYGGARPGRIGLGIYLVWPVFYTDVTDSYRLSKSGRLRTDLGGVYFNAICALVAGGGFLATGYGPLVLVIIGQQLLMLDQFIPWVRLDGYHIVSDLIGVSDLFERIRPILTSLIPGRPPDRRVTELKGWARAAVTVWVLTTVGALIGITVLIVTNAPRYLRQAWQSLILQLHLVAGGVRAGSIIDVVTGVIGAGMLLLPLAGGAATYLLLCRGAGAFLAVRSVESQGTSTIFPCVWPVSTWRKASRT